MPILFIGMPVYNGERFIGRALESLLRQTFTDWKLLISDNASTDSTQSICEDYCNKDERIHYYRQRTNIGGIGNFGFLLKAADCLYFMWAAADDLWDECFVEACIGALESDHQIGWAFTNMVNVDSFDRVIREYPSFNRFMHSDPCLSIAAFVLDPEYLGKANLIYGLFRLAECRHFMQEFLTGSAFGQPAGDVALNLGILCRTKLYIDERVLFMKRYVRPTDNPERLERIVAVAPYVNSVTRLQDFAAYRQAIAAACSGTGFEELVDYLMDYRERVYSDIDFVIKESRDGLLNSEQYRQKKKQSKKRKWAQFLTGLLPEGMRKKLGWILIGLGEIAVATPSPEHDRDDGMNPRQSNG